VASEDQRPDDAHGVPLVLAGTAVLALSGLIILGWSARVLGPVDYAVFGVFWSAFSFVVAVLAGAQQESSRAVSIQRRSPLEGRSSLLLFGSLLAVFAGVVIIGSAVWWSPPTLGDEHLGLGVLVGVGAIGYSLTGVLAGAFAGAGRWRVYAAMIAVEGVARAGAIAAVLVLSKDLGLLGWAVAAAYAIVLLVVALPRLALIRPLLHVSDPVGVLIRNTVRTVAATAAVAALVSGFPVLMSAFDGDADAATVGALTLVVLLTRAPLILPLLALQSLLVTAFADPARDRRRLMVILVGGCAAVACVLAPIAGVIGTPVLRAVFGDEFALDGRVIALLVLSSGVLGAVMMTTPALIATNRHTANAAGSVVALVVAVVVLIVGPSDLELRAPLALIIGPATGLAWHLVALTSVSAAGRHRRAGS